MSVTMDHSSPMAEMDSNSTVSSNWTINVSDIRTVLISNLSLAAIERDLRDFFSYSGDIQYIEIRRESETSQCAYVTFTDSQGVDSALLLSGATIIDLPVDVTPVENYQLPLSALPPPLERKLSGVDVPAVKKAEDVVSSMLAKGFILGKDALKMAKAFDERHQFLLNASAAASSFDHKIGLRQKLSRGTSMVHEKVREVDEILQVSEMTWSALAAAEHTANAAGTAIMSNRYLSTGASWLSTALDVVTKVAADVSLMTKEKVQQAEEDKKEILCTSQMGVITDFDRIHLDNGPLVPASVDSTEDGRLGII